MDCWRHWGWVGSICIVSIAYTYLQAGDCSIDRKHLRCFCLDKSGHYRSCTGELILIQRVMLGASAIPCNKVSNETQKLWASYESLTAKHSCLPPTNHVLYKLRSEYRSQYQDHGRRSRATHSPDRHHSQRW